VAGEPLRLNLLDHQQAVSIHAASPLDRSTRGGLRDRAPEWRCGEDHNAVSCGASIASIRRWMLPSCSDHHLHASLDWSVLQAAGTYRSRLNRACSSEGRHLVFVVSRLAADSPVLPDNNAARSWVEKRACSPLAMSSASITTDRRRWITDRRTQYPYLLQPLTAIVRCLSCR